MNPRRFSPSQTLCQIWAQIFETAKTGEALVIFGFYGNKRYAAFIYTHHLVQPPNMVVKLAEINILIPEFCAQTIVIRA